MKKCYVLNFFKKHKEVEILSIPKNDFNKNKLFYDLVLYFELENISIRYKNKL